ncbi:MAG: CoA transferase [Leifsonia sp.]
MRSTAHRPVLERVLRELGLDSESPVIADEPDAVPLPSNLPVPTLAADSVAAASVAAAAVVGARGSTTPAVRLLPRRIAAAYSSERVFAQEGRPPDVWAPLSGFWPTADGWIRTHGNYPHHAEHLRAGLRLTPTAGPDEVGERLAVASGADSAERITRAGGIAAVVARRDPDADSRWVGEPLVATATLGQAAPRPWGDGVLPLSGVRVLDLTRVIAGPVATRTLALFGADVLRIDSPRLPEIGWQHLDGGAGKRTALLDLESPSERERFVGLLETADVVVLGYRPSGLARIGLTPESLGVLHPGIVVGRLSAWGFEPGQADRRGFDSIVQAASGISWLESTDGGRPGALPAQALDHSAGYLLAAGIMAAVLAQRSEGGSRLVSTSLRRVAAELLTLPSIDRVPADPDLGEETVEHNGPAGRVRYVLPAPAYDGSPGDFAHPPHPWGSDEPGWLASP